MNGRPSLRTVAIVVLAVLALVALGGWFGLVSSQRSKSSTLDQQIAETQANLAAAKTLARARGGKGKEAPATLLATAFPADVRMPSILLQLRRLATASNVSLESVAPSAGTALTGYEAIPIELSVTGRYGEIQRFMRLLRMQAGSKGGHVHASGRLFAVETFGLEPGGNGLPELTGTMRIDAFVYSGAAPDASTTAESTSAAGSTSASAAAPVGTP